MRKKNTLTFNLLSFLFYKNFFFLDFFLQNGGGTPIKKLVFQKFVLFVLFWACVLPGRKRNSNSG